MRNRRLLGSGLITLTCLVAIFISIGSGSASKDNQQIDQRRPHAIRTDGLKPVPGMIKDSKIASADFQRRDLFLANLKSVSADAQLRQIVTEGVVIDLNTTSVQMFLSERPQFATLPLPDGKGGIIELDLKREEIFAPGFNIKTSKPTNESYDDSLGLHYSGMVKGNDQSLVAISVFKHEVMGFYSTEADGNYTLGRLGGDNPSDKHIVYAERNLIPKSPFHCDTEDSKVVLPESVLRDPEEVLAKCLRIYLEANNDIFVNKGSVAAVVTYLAGMFNECRTLFANDLVPVTISEIFVWNTASPYTGTTSLQQLQQFQAFRTTYNGNLAHLLSFQGGFGGIAYRPGLCNTSFGYAFSGINPTYLNVPTYSWPPNVFTHETGHNLGSSHTHACVWNGNATAIDACGPTAGYAYEGSCSGAPLPGPGGGTMMSYCHLVGGVGVNFTLGFGTQPRAVIVNAFNAATCAGDCGSASSAHPPADFDGEFKSDISVFRPANGTWYLSQSAAGFVATGFGQNGDIPTPGDFDGDGKTDLAVFRPANGTWYLLRTRSGFTATQFGANGDVPGVGDFDGDGKADIGVFRSLTGTWYLQRSTLGFLAFAFGTNGDIPTVGDYDGDLKADIAVFRPGNGTWYIQRSTLGFVGIGFGTNGDKPVPGDYDGDNKADCAVFRPGTGTWYVLRSLLGFTSFPFGANGDKPAPGDFDGDGKTDYAVFRPTTGAWYVQRSQLGFLGIGFGANGDIPAPGAYVP